MTRRILAIALAIIAILFVLAADDSVHILLDKANPPFMYATSDNSAVGVYPALLNEAFSRMKMSVSMEPMPWKRALDALDRGRAAVGGIYRTQERLKKYDFSDPLFEEVIQVVEARERPFPFDGLESMKGKRIGVLRGWSYGDEFDRARAEGLFIVEEVEGDVQNFLKLQAGRLDALIAVKEAANAAISSLASPRDFIVQAKPLTANLACLAFSKEVNQRKLLEEFNKTLAAMRQDGTWDKIVKSILVQH